MSGAAAAVYASQNSNYLCNSDSVWLCALRWLPVLIVLCIAAFIVWYVTELCSKTKLCKKKWKK